MPRLADRWKNFVQHYQKEIWQHGQLQGSPPRAWLYAALRVISITWTVFNETKAASRAAALSFSSLLGLGPLVALTVLIAGFTLGDKDPNLAANTLSRVMNFVAPEVAEFKHPRHTDQRGAPASESQPSAGQAGPVASAPRLPPATSPAASPEPDSPLNPRLVRMMNNFIVHGRSGSVGTVGGISLILIVLLLFKTVEDTFNEIWGVHRGRSLLTRIVYYWTILTLGAVLFFASVTLLGAGAFLGVFKETIAHLPFSGEFAAALRWSLPACSFALLVALLTVFYRVIPHTRVFWRAAFTGALVVASLLLLNNYLTFLYVRRVILTESLYGSLGFPLVVMFGLYIFWLYVLIGGQISYAVQNVHFRNSQAAWARLSNTMRERLCLVVLLTICRRFHAGLPPVAASHLGAVVKVPTQILNESLNRLVALKLITPVPPPDDDDSADLLYQPSRPLHRITLFDFKKLGDHHGDDPVGSTFEQLDPLVLGFNQAVERLGAQEFFQKNLDQLFAEHPFDESRPPFALGEKPGAKNS